MGGFHGRQTELRRVGEALRPGRPVTILGTAGTGKTRLAQQFARAHGEVVVVDDPPLHGRERARLEGRAARQSVLITAREVAAIPGEQVLALGPLPALDAHAMATELLPGAAERELRALISLVEGLPGAIARVAAVARPLHEALDDLTRAFDAVRLTQARLPRSAVMALVDAWSERYRVR